MKRFIASALATIMMVAPAFAAITVPNYTDGFDAGFPTTTVTGAISTTNGNCLVAIVNAQTNVPVMTDTGLNTFAQIDTPYSAPSTNIQYHFLACNITGNAADVITATCAGGCGFVGIEVYEVAGLTNTGTYGTSAAGATGTGTSATTAAIAPTNPTGIEFCQVVNTNQNDGFATTGSFTGHTNAGKPGTLWTMWQLTSGSLACNSTLTSATWEATAFTLNGPAASGANNQGMMSRGAQ